MSNDRVTGFERQSRLAEQVFESYPQGSLDEQAGPSYFRGLSLSRWMFWRRLKLVQKLLPATGKNALDFGTGFGLLLPDLSERFDQVLAVDIMPELSQAFIKRWSTDEFAISNISWLDDIGSDSSPQDLILALDVLEHVEHLDELLSSFAERLRLTHQNSASERAGQLIVSGPTENYWYRLGRRIVGFSGDYHVRNVFDIREAMEKEFQINQVFKIGLGFTLFEIYVATPRMGQ